MIFHVIIPTRFASTRLPGKPLLDIAGKPLIQHVYERAIQSSAASVTIATDDERIAEVAKKFGADVCMTAVEHQSGTERIAEVIDKLGFKKNDIIVNVQGDEPLVAPENIHQVAKGLKLNEHASMATLYCPFEALPEVFNPNIVKVVLDQQNYALYFSRAPIPWEQHHFQHDWSQAKLTVPHYRHYGLYAYTSEFVKQYIAWEPSPLEIIESLEQLRVLWYGGRIYCVQAQAQALPDVNTVEDLEKIRDLLR